MNVLPWGNREILSDDEFYNRSMEIANVKNLLSSTESGNAPDILLTGIRGVGKTVFLKKIKKELDDDYLVIYVNFSQAECFQKDNMSIVGLMEYYFKGIIAECSNDFLDILGERFNKFLRTNDVKIKDYTSIKDFPIPIFGSERNDEELVNFVLNLPNEIYERNSEKIKGVIIFIDEFQIIKELDKYMESFLWKFRSFIQNQPHVAYVLSGSMSLQDQLISQIASQGGVFGGRMLTLNLAPFSKVTVNQYLKEKAPDLIFTEEGFNRFYKCTSGIPAYVNIFGRLLPRNYELNEEIVLKEFNEKIPVINSHLVNIWTRLTYREQSIIVALLQKPIKRVEIANKVGVTTGSLSNALNSLINQNLIKLDNGLYAIAEPLLSKWLKLEYEIKGVYPYKIFL